MPKRTPLEADILSKYRMPVWEVVEEFRSEIRGRERSCLELRCAYCLKDMIVEKVGWYKRDEPNNGLTRPCPYCFRASYMPDAEAHAHKQGWDFNLEESRR
jgi:hypothetical protein